ncbi:DUF7453 family protein [Dokdonella immobilis]|uniref:Uncharacterized protein n=1 Tax=Dokdonella immobilis TaxID=578942 RepID=A0A1I5A531_9GAMM|nr:hypothetical protein [Dokdonella immobilis]SFN57574.1 hypothetical protein SAMN05216289_13227 [Dokdonella immobilis]
MPTNPILIRSLVASLALAVSLPEATAASLAYSQVELQARTNLLVNDNGWNLPPGSSFNSISASINNEGTVAFPVQIVPINGSQSNTGVGLWVGAHGAGGIVALHEPPVDGISDRTSINAGGEVAYYTYEDGSSYRLRRYDPGTMLSVIVNTLPLTPTSFSGHVINDAGVIGYRAGLGSGYGLASTGAGSSLLHIVDSNVQPGPYAFIYTPAMNANRLIACKVSIGDFSHNEIRSFASDGSYTALAVDAATDPTSPYRRFDNGLAYNSAGQLAVVLNLDAGNVRAIYRLTPNGGTVDAVEIARVEATGTIRDIESFAPAMNAAGLVVFRARDANGQALYAGDGKTLVRVIGKEDPVTTDLGPARIGQHIDDPSSWPIFSGAPGVNDNGDIAFIGALHPDGDTQVEWGSGVFVAYAGGDPIFSDGFDGP